MNLLANMALYSQIAFFVAIIVTGYWYWVRPILKERPGCTSFYAATDSWLAAIRLRFQGIKGALAGALAKIVTLIVLLHDELIPYATGVDWSPLTGKVPTWAWPVIVFLGFWFMGKAREWAERRGDDR